MMKPKKKSLPKVLALISVGSGLVSSGCSCGPEECKVPTCAHDSDGGTVLLPDGGPDCFCPL